VIFMKKNKEAVSISEGNKILDNLRELGEEIIKFGKKVEKLTNASQT
jgi:hypothetical protein